MALEVRIIGKGCYFCKQLRKIVDELVVEMRVPEAQVEQVDRLDELLEYGVVNPPALVVNGKLKMMGRVLVRSRVRCPGRLRTRRRSQSPIRRRFRLMPVPLRPRWAVRPAVAARHPGDLR